MRVLVAGATGVIGRQLVPQLQQAGHEVISLSSKPPLQHGGGEVVITDALDRVALTTAVMAVEPDAVVHLMTAIPKNLNPRRLASEFALTNRLRTDGTRNLADASKAAGSKRFITQGLAYAYRPARGLGVGLSKLLVVNRERGRGVALGLTSEEDLLDMVVVEIEADESSRV